MPCSLNIYCIFKEQCLCTGKENNFLASVGMYCLLKSYCTTPCMTCSLELCILRIIQVT